MNFHEDLVLVDNDVWATIINNKKLLQRDQTKKFMLQENAKSNSYQYWSLLTKYYAYNHLNVSLLKQQNSTRREPANSHFN